jgi:hypothetical protein
MYACRHTCTHAGIHLRLRKQLDFDTQACLLRWGFMWSLRGRSSQSVKSVIGAHNKWWKYLLGAISKNGEAKRDVEFIGEDKDRQLESLWRETRIGDVLPWGDVACMKRRGYLMLTRLAEMQKKKSRRWMAGKRPRSRPG